jgi:hypothetical protein
LPENIKDHKIVVCDTQAAAWKLSETTLVNGCTPSPPMPDGSNTVANVPANLLPTRAL